MDTVRITKEFTFEMAHALHGYDGKCANIHGHSYLLTITVIGNPIIDKSNPKLGMVIDFGDLKKIVKEEVINEFDHALVLKETDPILQQQNWQNQHLIQTSFQPTCENLLLEFVSRISKRIQAPHRLHSMVLRETSTSYASWFAEDNE